MGRPDLVGGEAVESTVLSADRPIGDGSGSGDKGLKANAICFISNVVIGVASTAPGYSLAWVTPHKLLHISEVPVLVVPV
jgi:hypothetical protein